MLAESEAMDDEDADEFESEREGREVVEAGERERSGGDVSARGSMVNGTMSLYLHSTLPKEPVTRTKRMARLR